MYEKGSKTSDIKVQNRIQPILEYSGVLIPEALATRTDERGKVSAMELKPKWWRWRGKNQGGGFLRRGGGALEGGAEGAGASTVTRRRDRANPVCDWRRASGGGRSGDASQGQAEARMAWADATPRPEHPGVLGPRARKGVDGEVPRTQAPIR